MKSSLDISQLSNSKDEFYRKFRKGTMNQLRVAMPGIVQSFNPIEQTVTVQPALRETIIKPDQTREIVNLPLLLDVPVYMPRGGNYVLTTPIKKGDECLVIFNDMCIDAWWSYGGIQNQLEKRRHDLSDTIALVGIWSQPNRISNYSTDSAQLRNQDGTTYVELNDSDVNLVGTVNINSKNFEDQLFKKVDKVEGKQLSTEDYTTDEKQKLSGIQDNANDYIHPDTHPGNMITEDSTHRWVSDTEKSNWNNANSEKHTHNNLSLLQTLTQTLVNAWNSAVDHITDTVKHITSDERNLWNTVSDKAEKAYVDTELNKRYLKNETYDKEETDQRIQNIIGAAPAALDTLKEIADSLGDDKDFAGTMTNNLAKKVDKVDGKQLSTEDYTTDEKQKLSGIQDNANDYIHPDTHPGNMITEDSTHRWVSDTEKSNWNNANSEKHTHNNLSLLQTLTQTLVNAWNSAVDHITDTVKHITSDERNLWNTVSDKAEKAYVDTELNKRYLKNETYDKEETDQRIQNIIGAAPAALDTLKEIADSLGDDKDFAGTMTNNLAKKVDKVDGKQLSTEDYTTLEKAKLAGVQDNANNYTHPATHPATMIANDSKHEFVADSDISNWNSKANGSHTHVKSDITDFPSSMPANGGNSDTVDGKHAGDFALSGHDEMPSVNNETEKSFSWYSQGVNYHNHYSGHSKGSYRAVLTAKDGNTGIQFETNWYIDPGSTPNEISYRVKRDCAGDWSSWCQLASVNQIPTSLPASGGTADKATITHRLYRHDPESEDVYYIAPYWTGNTNGWRIGAYNTNGDEEANIHRVSVDKADYADSSGNADTVDGHHFNWSGQGGQPAWLWGGNDSNNMYVYNPSNFSVNNSSQVSGHTASATPATSEKNDIIKMINEVFTDANNGKSNIYNAIIGKGVTPAGQNFANLVGGINAIGISSLGGKRWTSSTTKSNTSGGIYITNLNFKPSIVLARQKVSTGYYNQPYLIMSQLGSYTSPYYAFGGIIDTGFYLTDSDAKEVQIEWIAIE